VSRRGSTPIIINEPLIKGDYIIVRIVLQIETQSHSKSVKLVRSRISVKFLRFAPRGKQGVIAKGESKGEKAKAMLPPQNLLKLKIKPLHLST